MLFMLAPTSRNGALLQFGARFRPDEIGRRNNSRRASRSCIATIEIHRMSHVFDQTQRGNLCSSSWAEGVGTARLGSRLSHSGDTFP